MAIEVRGARAQELPEVLDMVPRVMGATREYFASAYRNDPCARPEHSRIVRVDGDIVSHIRLYDRWQRVGPVAVHVGCVGDVCTLPEHRKRGHCRALLEDPTWLQSTAPEAAPAPAESEEEGPSLEQA